MWHFILLPTLAMGAVILLSRAVDGLVLTELGPVQRELYGATRAIAISLIMASLITWLAIAYRRQYEARLRARAEALESTRRFLARIIEGSGEAIVTLDPEQRITSWNRAAENIYGWTSEEMVGSSVGRLWPPGPQPEKELRQIEQQLRAGHTLRDYQMLHARRDGTRITVRLTLSPFHDATGGYEGSTAIVRDVTSLVRMEARLREQDRLAAVGRLSAQVAHEIKNPLAGIRGACEVMMSRLEADRDQEIAAEVVRQIDRLNRTVEELLLFARPAKAVPQPTALHELIERVLGLLLEDPRAARLRLTRRYADELPAVSVDPEQMQQVLFNVLLNAAQAMNYDGELTVLTSRENEGVTVAVRDCGPGISEEAARMVFEPFYTTRVQGSGLGLAIVKKIVQAHHGSVEARRAPGGGAELRIHLPLAAGTR